MVGLYSGLAAGLFANLIALVSGLALGLPRVLDALLPESGIWEELVRAFSGARWHFEYFIVGVPLGLGVLVLARIILPNGDLETGRHHRSGNGEGHRGGVAPARL